MSRTITILFLCLIVSACNLASIGGRYADWYTMKKIDDYLDLTDEQEKHLKPLVTAHINWLKKQQISQINQTLDELVERIKGGLKEADLTWIETRLENLRAKFDKRLRPDALWLLTRLQKSQVNHLQEAMTERRKRWQERLSKDPDEFREDRFERYGDNFESWFGSITPSQRRKLHEMFSDLADIEHARLYYEGSSEVQKAFLEVVTPPTNRNRIDSYLTRWMKDPASLRTGAREALYRKRQQIFRSSVLAIDKMISDEQRRHLIKEIRSIQEDLVAFGKYPS